jgi:hypothetical protein
MAEIKSVEFLLVMDLFPIANVHINGRTEIVTLIMIKLIEN